MPKIITKKAHENTHKLLLSLDEKHIKTLEQLADMATLTEKRNVKPQDIIRRMLDKWSMNEVIYKMTESKLLLEIASIIKKYSKPI